VAAAYPPFGLRGRETGVLVALLVMCRALSLLNDRFLTSTNLLNIGRQVSLLGIMAVGMTFVIVSGEIDLSVGLHLRLWRPRDGCRS
jgi:ribose transport system permease protein